MSSTPDPEESPTTPADRRVPAHRPRSPQAATLQAEACAAASGTRAPPAPGWDPAAALLGDRPGEAHDRSSAAGRLNWLRAAVLGANDGIVSTAGLVIGVAGATSAKGPILTAGVAGLVAGAVSMALGEYVSVSSARDSERALLERTRRQIDASPEVECAELAGIYQAKGLSEGTAWQVASELTERDAFAAHADAELGIDPDALVSPVNAAVASALAFSLGALLPLLAILVLPSSARLPATFVVVLLALALTGALAARIGGARLAPAVVRIVLGGAVGMGSTFLVGRLLGTAI